MSWEDCICIHGNAITPGCPSCDRRSLEQELQATREELAEARKELAHKENAPIEGRVADEDRYMVSLLRLQSRVRALEEEERRLAVELNKGEGSWETSRSTSPQSEVSA